MIAAPLRRLAPPLSLQGNRFGKQGAAQLPEILAAAANATCLRLHNDSIAARGAPYLATALLSRAPRQELWLGGNVLCGCGVAKALEAASCRMRLREMRPHFATAVGTTSILA